MIPFVKAHACGNDFLILDEALAGRQHAALARRLCARNTGVGADGIEFLERRAREEFFLRLFNADGSEAELSGNGTRCVAAWLAQSEGLEQVTLGTHAGLRRCTLIEGARPLYRVATEMGVPRVMRRTIALDGIGNVEGALVNVGNPHFVTFPENEDFSMHGLTWQQLGEKISVSPLFPHGTNVEFVRVTSPEEIAFRIFERGCGPTQSSGTGSSAAAAAAMMLRDVARTLVVVAEGGPQSVTWPGEREELVLTGSAEIICTGEIELEVYPAGESAPGFSTELL